MTSDLDNAPGAGDRARTQAYYRDFWPSVVGYVAVLSAVLIWGGLDGNSPSRFLWALLPVVPALWTVRAVMRHVRRIDDYQQVLLLHALAVGFAIAMLASLTVGFLGVAGLPMQGAGWVIYSAGMLGWLVAGLRARRR